MAAIAFFVALGLIGVAVVEFVRLLIGLEEIDDWDYDEQLRGWGCRFSRRHRLT